MDDFLDLRYDIFVGASTLATRLGEGTLPYALIGFALAVGCNAELAAAIMVGAYAVGMAGDYDRQLPSGLMGYQEGVVVTAASLWLLPWQTLLWALAAMLAVQVFDDLHDLLVDRESGNPNIARRVGIVEARMTAMASVSVAGLLMPVETATVFVAIPIITWLSRAATRPTARARGWAP